jgi:hypothetical protein
MKKRKQISSEEAKRIGDSLYIDWAQLDLEQFRQGLMGNHQQTATDPETGQIYESVLLTGKIVLAHAQEIPDYFSRLAKLQAELDRHQGRKRKHYGQE